MTPLGSIAGEHGCENRREPFISRFRRPPEKQHFRVAFLCSNLHGVVAKILLRGAGARASITSIYDRPAAKRPIQCQASPFESNTALRKLEPPSGADVERAPHATSAPYIRQPLIVIQRSQGEHLWPNESCGFRM